MAQTQQLVPGRPGSNPLNSLFAPANLRNLVGLAAGVY